MLPETVYAKVGDQHVAYQVFGEGPPDLVFTVGSFANTELIWEDPAAALFLRRLGVLGRVIQFDHRGSGASDPLPPEHLPPWESHGLEVEAVLDAADSERAVVFGVADGAAAGMSFAATRPERTSGLILFNAWARQLVADDYPIGLDAAALADVARRVEESWARGEMADDAVPSRAGDDRFRRWFARYARTVGTPAMVRRAMEASTSMDVRAFLPAIAAPTLVMQRTGFPELWVEQGRYVAAHIPSARLVEIPGSDRAPYWEAPDAILAEVRQFLASTPERRRSERFLATLLFTDIVRSTERLQRVGDREWREVLAVHDALADRVVADAGGRLVDTTGDGILASFGGPGRAVGCAVELVHQLRAIDLEIRAGLHTGEVERDNGEVRGLAVHLANRIMAEAAPGEILVSRTVRDLVGGSGIKLADRGVRTFKGLDQPWEVFAVLEI